MYLLSALLKFQVVEKKNQHTDKFRSSEKDQ